MFACFIIITLHALMAPNQAIPEAERRDKSCYLTMFVFTALGRSILGKTVPSVLSNTGDYHFKLIIYIALIVSQRTETLKT